MARHRLTIAESIKGAKKLLRNKKVQRNKAFSAALQAYIIRQGSRPNGRLARRGR